jgi:menaquinone-9 beta-reductase
VRASPPAIRIRSTARQCRDLDALLLDAAIAAGADFVPGVAVRGAVVGRANAGPHIQGVRVATAAGNEDWRAGIVIAADGRHSALAFSLGLARYAAAPRRWAFGAYFTDVQGEMHVRTDGYIGVAPLPYGLTNLCVVRELGTAPPLGDRMNAEQTIAAALASEPLLRERFANARRVSPITTLGPLAVEARAAGAAGLLLAGDAAGFIDPMTGDGLRFALRGGELAAEAALRELASGQPACADLRRARSREFSGKWRVNRCLRSLVASPRGVSLAASISAHWSAPVRALVAIAGDVHLARRRHPPC